jgi:sulfite reductase (ferredoxin)
VVVDASETGKLSKVEAQKRESDGLAGNLAEFLAGDATHMDDYGYQILKFHGSYQQDNRDTRIERRRQKLDKDWIFMVRAKIPGGRLTTAQYRAMDQIASNYTYGSIRLTSRQGIQFHGVGRENLKNLIAAVNESGLTTIGACGDVNRNAMACPVCDLDERAPLGIDALTRQLAEHFAPRSTAYWEIWCDGVRLGRKIESNREEPIYGRTYLPRKFKIGVGVPEDNCIDLYTQDLGIEAVHEAGELKAWDILVGGGMGFTMSKEETYPRLAVRLVRCAPDEVIEVAEAIVTIQRDFGNRETRHRARLKYTLEDMGVEAFRAELFRRLGRELPPAGPMPAYRVQDHLGWRLANDGSWYLGIRVQNGRITDTAQSRMQSGLRALTERFGRQIRITAQQNLVLVGIDETDKAAVEGVCAEFGIPMIETLSPLRRRSMACPALPTCGLALAESERAIPTILEKLEQLGSADHQIEFRMTGCPNSCVRTPTAELGIVGRGPGKYAIYAGGSPAGTRLAAQIEEKVDFEQLPDMLHRLIQTWRSEADDGEPFGDWSHRVGVERLRNTINAA